LKAIKDAYLNLNNQVKATQTESYLRSQVFGQQNYLNKLILGNLDHADYDRLLTDEVPILFSNQRISDAKEFFDTKLQGFNELSLDELFTKLMHIAVIVRLEITDIKDAYKLFETFNNRGLPLSAADLIKNLILGRASKINGGAHLEEVKDLWAQIIIQLDGLDKGDLDVFFRRYFSSVLKQKITKNALIDKFKAYYVNNIQDNDRNTVLYGENGQLDDEDNQIDIQPNDANEALENGNISIVQFLTYILNAAITYRKLCLAQFGNELIDYEVQRLNDILCDTSYTFLMQFMQQDISPECKSHVIRMVATLMLRRHICGKQTGENDTIFARLVRHLDNIPDMRAFFDGLYNSLTLSNIYPGDDEFKNHLKIYNKFNNASLQPRARVLLDTYNTSLNDDLRQPETAYASICQIIPEILTNDWQDYLGDNANARVLNIANSLGNLTLLTTPIPLKNNNAQNPFKRLERTYSEDPLSINANLALKNDFTFDDFDSRSEEISEAVKEYWKIIEVDCNMETPPQAGDSNNPSVLSNNPVLPDSPPKSMKANESYINVSNIDTNNPPQPHDFYAVRVNGNILLAEGKSNSTTFFKAFLNYCIDNERARLSETQNLKDTFKETPGFPDFSYATINYNRVREHNSIYYHDYQDTLNKIKIIKKVAEDLGLNVELKFNP
jgi:hypothetical protein